MMTIIRRNNENLLYQMWELAKENESTHNENCPYSVLVRK